MNKKFEKKEEQIINAEEVNFVDVEQLEDIAAPGFIGTIGCSC